MRKFVFIGIFCVVGLSVFAVWEYLSFYDGKLWIVICDVGQGDGVIIKSPQGRVMLFDSGPDERILDCISENTPFWIKDLDLVMISHPHADHFMGMFSVLTNYTVKTYMSEKIKNRSTSFEELENLISAKNVPVKYLGKGDRISFPDGLVLHVRGPSEAFLERVSPTGNINDVTELVSLIVEVEYGDFTALLTGDSQVSGLEDAGVRDVVFLQVPHHGSASGLDARVLGVIDPEVATISVGKNKYGHPTEEILSLLEDDRINTYRTDELGSISITTDGRVHWIGKK